MSCKDKIIFLIVDFKIKNWQKQISFILVKTEVTENTEYKNTARVSAKKALPMKGPQFSRLTAK